MTMLLTYPPPDAISASPDAISASPDAILPLRMPVPMAAALRVSEGIARLASAIRGSGAPAQVASP